MSLWMFTLGILHVPFSRLTIGFPLLGFSLICLIASKTHPKNSQSRNTFVREPASPPSIGSELLRPWQAGVILSYIAINVFMVIWQTLNVPVHFFDELATIAFKAKIFFYERSLPDLSALPHSPYPLMVPFLQSWIALSTGGWSDLSIKTGAVLCLLSFLLMQYEFLKRLTSRTHAMAGVALLLSANLFCVHATTAYQDFTMMYFNCATLMLLVLWHASGNLSYLKLSSLMAGLGTFVKMEGTAYLLIHIFIFMIINSSQASCTRQQKIKNLRLFIVPAVGICLMFHLHKIICYAWLKGIALTEKTRIDFYWGKILLVPHMIKVFLCNIFLTGNWNLVWLLTAPSFFRLRRKNQNQAAAIVKTALISYITLYFGVGFLTENYVWIFGESNITGASRLILHYFPLAVLVIVLDNYK